MKPGEQLYLRIIDRIDDKRAHVTDINNENEGILLIKGNLRILKNGTVNAWVIQRGKIPGTYVYGNSYFGKYTISKNIATRYKDILKKLYENPDNLVADDISFLKGMCKRCLLHDQWDWFTTYQYLGYPYYSVLRNFVSDAITLRNSLRVGNYNTISIFKSKYHGILSSMMFHLFEYVDVEDEEAEIPVFDLDPLLWARMSFQSRKNIKIVDKIINKSSNYILMHYFVTLEQEFNDHFIAPYLKNDKVISLKQKCLNIQYQRTHDILTGKVHFTLGAASFLGKYIKSEEAKNSSDTIKQFADFLGNKKNEFVTICSLIATECISGITVPQIRNGLAHGDSEILKRVDSLTFTNLYSYMFKPPQQVMQRILLNSLKYR